MSLPPNWPQDSDWTPLVEPMFAGDSMKRLFQFIDIARMEATVLPAEVDVFNAFRLCSFTDTNVVILGQDPYHGEGQAHGLSFSVLRDQKLPPSLRNIFKELREDIGCQNDCGDLTNWAKQGVLLLNTVLTVESGKAHSHKNQGWEIFTDFIIELIGSREKPAVFILWGKPAEKKRLLISNHHCVIQSPHPSPLSAHRGFFGSRPFSRTNTALNQFGADEIDWQICRPKSDT